MFQPICGVSLLLCSDSYLAFIDWSSADLYLLIKVLFGINKAKFNVKTVKAVPCLYICVL